MSVLIDHAGETCCARDLFDKLSQVKFGLTSRDVVEQSSCFAFQGGKVFTFNDEIACRSLSPLGLEGAVHGHSLLAILRNLGRKQIEVSQAEGELILSSGGDRFAIPVQKEIRLPIEKVEAAKAWQPLPKRFVEAVASVLPCVGKDESQYTFTCVHLHPSYIEAVDSIRGHAARYRFRTKVREPVLIRGSSIGRIVGLSVTEFSETAAWIHFRNEAGLVFSCRRDAETTIESIGHLLTGEGRTLTLPSDLAVPGKRSEEIVAELGKGKLRIDHSTEGQWQSPVSYRGPKARFTLLAGQLRHVAETYGNAVISEDRLTARTDRLTYVVALGRPDDELDG